jgi:hypothetical protein
MSVPPDRFLKIVAATFAETSLAMDPHCRAQMVEN